MKKISLVILCLLILQMVPMLTGCGLPTAAFTADVTSGPAPLNVTFSNITQKVGADSKVVFDWDFGDGTKQAAAKVTDPIKHEYTIVGTYTVKMTGYSSDAPDKTSFVTQNITVTHGTLSKLTVKPETVELKIGQIQAFTSAAFDNFENPILEAALTWTAGSAGIMTTDGSFTAGKIAGVFDKDIVGTGELSGSKVEVNPKITILPDPLDAATLESLQVSAGESRQLVAVAKDQYGNKISDLQATWNVVDANAGTITSDGLFTASRKAVSYDNAIKVTFKQGNKTAEAAGKVLIKAGELTQIGIAPENFNLGKGMTQQYVAAGADKYGNRIDDISFNWSVEKSAGTITDKGLFKASESPGIFKNGIQVSAKNGNNAIIKSTNITVNPDRILFYSNRADENKDNLDIYRMNSDGSDVQRLFSMPGDDFGDLDCSFDGRRLIYTIYETSSATTYITDIDGTTTSAITTGKYLFFSISPDGQKLVFINANGSFPDLYLMDIDGGHLVQLTHDSKIELYPSWSPDGKQIIYMSQVSSSENPKIWVINVDGSGQKALTTGAGGDAIASFSPDGTKIVFESNRNSAGRYSVYVMNADGSNVAQVNPASSYGAYFPSWSADGKKITFHSVKDDPNDDIYTINLDGTDLTRITKTTSVDMFAKWLPSAQGVLVNEDSVVIKTNYDIPEKTAKNITAAASPAVVRIKTDLGSGSGFIISADGLVMTNNHVISGAKTITVYLTDGNNYKGTVIRDMIRDLALIEISANNLPFLEIGNLDETSAGQQVLVLGYPLGQETISVSSGLLSAVKFDSGSNVSWLQTDSAINPGNSGGPLLDMQGKVIGIVSAKFVGVSIEGMGFAISATTLNLYYPFMLLSSLGLQITIQ